MPMDRLVPVSQKGQVVIPAALRKKHKIGRTVVIAEADGEITIEPSQSMEESFGADGDAMLKVAREISRERGAKSSLSARS
jgi:AbrB family looped-hinge helix DNA binding protein